MSGRNGVHFTEHIETLVRDIRRYAEYFCAMALGQETDIDLKRAFHDLRELKVDVAYPLLLEIYEDYKAGMLQKADFIRAIRLIESYVFRRAICAISTSSMNKTFATMARALDKNRFYESMLAHLLILPSYRRFPNDEEFQRNFQVRDLYNFRSRSYWLRRFENFGRKELIAVDDYTIEHILPQNEHLNSQWRAALGAEWSRVQQTWLHTLGNLTLTGYNSEYSDRPFSEKRDMKGGFRESPLKLNEGLGQTETWDEQAIKSRAIRLAARASDVWARPHLDAESVAQYQTKPPKIDGYTIDDHPHMAVSSNRQIFDAMKAAILALDPCVTVSFLKYYVAFKAETNFADVTPYAKKFRVDLYVDFHVINDPKSMCHDRYGDASVYFSAPEDVPYILGLIRQSLELQLGGPEA